VSETASAGTTGSISAFVRLWRVLKIDELLYMQAVMFGSMGFDLVRFVGAFLGQAGGSLGARGASASPLPVHKGAAIVAVSRMMPRGRRVGVVPRT
jgi:hypothetical protein